MMGRHDLGYSARIDDRLERDCQGWQPILLGSAPCAVPQLDQWRALWHARAAEGTLYGHRASRYFSNRLLQSGRDPLPRLLRQCLQVNRSYIIGTEAATTSELPWASAGVTRLQQQAGRHGGSQPRAVKVESFGGGCLFRRWVNSEEKKRPGFLEAAISRPRDHRVCNRRRTREAAGGDRQGGA